MAAEDVHVPFNEQQQTATDSIYIASELQAVSHDFLLNALLRKRKVLSFKTETFNPLLCCYLF